jgi:hypothetical protein
MRVVASKVHPGHPDLPLLSKVQSALEKHSGGIEVLVGSFPTLVREAIDFVLDPIRTARTSITDLDNVEKTFIGLKVEHLLRDFLDIPKGLRDLEVDGMDVDIKNTVRDTWMIPPETYGKEEPCLVIASEEATHRCWLGIIIARDKYLSKPNRDKKRAVSSKGFENILWLVNGAPYQKSLWRGIDMARFRELRKLKGGKKRAVAFFKENPNKKFHRSVVQGLLFDQLDYMKRVRANGGARDVLRKEGIALLSGLYDSELITELGLSKLNSEEVMAVLPKTPQESNKLRAAGVID